jgi:RNA polymerase sigma-70 factor (ECF subfamily)
MICRYDPLLDRWSRRGLDNPSDIGEFKQQLWIEVARRIVSFRYDPKRSFRSWLKTLHASRLSDFRKSSARAKRNLDRFGAGLSDADLVDMRWAAAYRSRTDPAEKTTLEAESRLAAAREAVRTRVTERSWAIFWAISVEDRSIRDTADAFGMTYTAAFAAHARVRKALKAEIESGESR